MDMLWLFVTLLIMTSVTVLLICITKFLFKGRLSPVFHYYIWLLLVIRLIFPVLPQSELSVCNVFVNMGVKITDVKSVYNESLASFEFSRYDATDINKSNTVSDSGKTVRVEPSIDKIDGKQAEPVHCFPWDLIIISVYVAVAAVLLLRVAVKYKKQRTMQLEASAQCEIAEINAEAEYLCTELGINRNVPIRIGTKSLLFGIIDPFIVISENNLDDYRMILAHELTHRKWHDNAANLVFAILKSIYWFNPLLSFAFNYAVNDMELLCDYRTVNKLRLRKDEYAMLLYKSVKLHDGGKMDEGQLASSSSMSTAGKQLIKRLSFLSVGKKPNVLIKALSIVVLVCIVMVCLTNPILNGKANRNTYLNSFSELVGDSISVPGKNDYVTAIEFVNSLIAAVDALNADDMLANTYENAEAFLSALSDEYSVQRPEVYQKLIAPLLAPESLITREQAAFILSNFIVLMQREAIFPINEDGEIDESIYLPKIMEMSIMNDLLDMKSAESDSLGVRKLTAFYTMKEYAALENDYQAYEMNMVFPFVNAFGVCIFDPYASEREINILSPIAKKITDFSAVPQKYANNPNLLPIVISEDSFEKNLIGKADNDIAEEIKEIYEYDRRNGVYRLNEALDHDVTLEYTYADGTENVFTTTHFNILSVRISRETGYTYLQMLNDHAENGFFYVRDTESDETDSELNAMGIRGYKKYSDEASINKYSLECVKYLSTIGLFKNGGRFNPNEKIKFGETAEIAVKLAAVLVAG